MATTKGKKRVKCTHPGCKKHSVVSVSELSCVTDVGSTWMCWEHDEQRTMRENRRGSEGQS